MNDDNIEIVFSFKLSLKCLPISILVETGKADLSSMGKMGNELPSILDSRSILKFRYSMLCCLGVLLFQHNHILI